MKTKFKSIRVDSEVHKKLALMKLEKNLNNINEVLRKLLRI